MLLRPPRRLPQLHPPPPPPPAQNTAPTADAGDDQEVSATLLVEVDGSGSADADGDVVTFEWSLSAVPAGSGAVLDDQTAAQSSFVPDLPGTYVVELVVNDGTVDSTPDQVTITAIDNSSTAMITAAGGEIQSKDGDLTLSIPAGALTEPTEIRLTRVLPLEDGISYDLSPSGLQFSAPATATLEVQANEFSESVDENGDPLNLDVDTPGVLLFLLGTDDEEDEMLPVTLVSDDETDVITITTEIPHFSGLAVVASEGFQAFFEWFDTHYVGPTFRRNFTTKYLGYETTWTYGKSSIRYVVKNLSVTRFDFSGDAKIKFQAPTSLARDDFLNERGQTAATRPRIFCDAVGTGKVSAEVTAMALVEATFLPKNKTLNYEVPVTMTARRKGECVAPLISDGSTWSQDDAEETAVARSDPADDVQLVTGSTLSSAQGLGAPAAVDLSGGLVAISGDPGEEVLSGSLSVRDMIPSMSSGMDSFLSFDFTIIDPTAGATGAPLFQDVIWDFSLDGTGANAPLTLGTYRWDGSSQVAVANFPVTFILSGQWLVFSVSLLNLGLTVEQAQAVSFRMITQLITTRSGASQYFADLCTLPPISDMSAFSTCP